MKDAIGLILLLLALLFFFSPERIGQSARAVIDAFNQQEAKP